MTVKSQIIDKHTRCFVTEVVPWINEHAAVLTLPLTWELLIITFSYFLRSLQNSLYKIHHCASSLSICFCLHTKYVLFSPTFETEFPFISAATFDAIEIWNYQFWQDTAAPRPHLLYVGEVAYKAWMFRLTMIWLRVRLRDILHFWRRLFTIMIQQLVPPKLQISSSVVVLINPSPPRGSPLMSKIVWR